MKKELILLYCFVSLYLFIGKKCKNHFLTLCLTEKPGTSNKAENAVYDEDVFTLTQ